MPASAATGRRKTAAARARLTDGSGKVVVNGRALEDYFPVVNQQNTVLAPLQVTNATQKFDISISIKGGGVTGQAGAARHAVARALVAQDAELRKALRDAGHMTRDPRMKERKKPGRPGARKRFQFSKR
jgi:small subunit ribosomal protein S9